MKKSPRSKPQKNKHAQTEKLWKSSHNASKLNEQHSDLNMPNKRGRPTRLNAALTKRLCKHISNACTVQAACECENISTKSFFEWLNRGETGEQPFSYFRKSVMRARGWFNARVCKSIIEEKDWRARLELLARIYPLEFARSAERPLPTVEPEPKKVSIALVLNTGGKTLEEVVNFPMIEGRPPPAPEQEQN